MQALRGVAKGRGKGGVVMSVKIVGMEMPKSCDKCRFVWPKRYDVCCLADKEHKIIQQKEIDRPSWCPLQEVKE